MAALESRCAGFEYQVLDDSLHEDGISHPTERRALRSHCAECE